ncbi:MAG: hypothetical protein LH624_19860, partial [Cryobacterium sp.]|nr:hypothetical protein [Cryobacterium sp.]
MERFGFDGLGTVTAWVSRGLDDTWGISGTGCSRMVISDHNAIVWVASDRGDLVVKWSRARHRFASLDASTGLLRVQSRYIGSEPLTTPSDVSPRIGAGRTRRRADRYAPPAVTGPPHPGGSMPTPRDHGHHHRSRRRGPATLAVLA